MGVLQLSHLLSTLGMTAVIWFVQLVHYPLFASVGESAFASYEAGHTTRISWIVIPLMLIELGTACALLLSPEGRSSWLTWAGLLLLAVIWGSTFFLQVPLHQKLSTGFDAEAIRQLVQTNWIRTIGWSLRAVLVCAALQQASVAQSR